jgi:hypothetical protein
MRDPRRFQVASDIEGHFADGAVALVSNQCGGCS